MTVSHLSAPVPEEMVLEILIIIEPWQISLNTDFQEFSNYLLFKLHMKQQFTHKLTKQIMSKNFLQVRECFLLA